MRISAALGWLCIAAIFGYLALLQYQHTRVITPAPASSAPAPVESAIAVPTCWEDLKALEPVEGEWVGENGPAVGDGGMPIQGGATVHIDPLEKRSPAGHKRWTFWASFGDIALKCSILKDSTSEGTFPGLCTSEKSSKAMQFHIRHCGETKLQLVDYGVTLRRP